MAEYVTSCNPTNFDLISFFENSNTVYWKQNRDFNVGDKLYIYLTKPYGRLMFCCLVVKTNIITPPTLYDYYKQQNNGKYKDYPFVELKLKYKLPEKGFSLQELLDNGLKTVQCTTKASSTLIEYIDNRRNNA